MPAIPLIYEAPLFVFVILGLFTIYRVNTVRMYIPEGNLRKSYLWIVLATIFLTLWAVDHMYHDLIPLDPELVLFFHYGISHGFLLIGMICVSISALKIQDAYDLGELKKHSLKNKK